MSRFILLLALFFTSNALIAQQTFVLDQSQSSVVVQGTSSVHDWESNAEKIEGSATISMENDMVKEITGLQLNVDASSIKSGKRIMDNKTEDALQAKKHPKITFTYDSVQSVTQDSVTVTGTLSIAGAEQQVELSGAWSVESDGNLRIQGAEALMMSSYGIEAPTAMMGTLKTGDEVTIAFNVLFSPKK